MVKDLSEKFEWKRPLVSDFIKERGLTKFSIEPTIEVFKNGLLKIGFNVVGEMVVENKEPKVVYSYFGEFMLKNNNILSRDELCSVFRFVENQMWETPLSEYPDQNVTLQDMVATQGERELTDEVIYIATDGADRAIYQLWDIDK